MKIKFVPLSLALVVLILAGCSHRKPPAVPQTEPRDTTYTRQNESFDPLSIRDEDAMKLPDSRLKTSSGSSSGRTSEKSGRKTHEAAGFRVQLIATETEAEARNLEQSAMVDFTESVYLVFDPPNYKVRVGDCSSRPLANDLREKALRLGYNNAWVVQSRVIVPDR
jgi:hypothetical protein